MKKRNKGFTIIELIVVIAAMAVLTSVSGIAYVKFVDKSKVEANKQEVLSLVSLLDTALVEEEEYDYKGVKTVFNSYEYLNATLIAHVYEDKVGQPLPSDVEISCDNGTITYIKRGITTKYDINTRNFVNE